MGREDMGLQPQEEGRLQATAGSVQRGLWGQGTVEETVCVAWFLGEGQLEGVHPTVEQVI